MLGSIGTILGLIAGAIGALWLAYIKIRDYWFTDQVSSDESKLTNLSKTLTDIENQTASDKQAAQSAAEAYDKANSSDTSGNSGK